MAYIVGKLVEYQASGATITPNYSNIIWDTRLSAADRAILADDLILNGIANRQPTGTTLNAATGYTAIGTYGRQSNQAHLWFRKKATGGESGVAYTVENTDCICITLIIRGCETTPTIVVGSRKDWTNSASVTPAGAELPTATAGDLVIHSCSSNNTSCFSRNKINDATALARYDASNVALAVSYKQIESAGTVSAAPWYNRVATNGGNAWVITIKSATGAAYQPDIRTNITEANWYGLHGAVNSAVTWVKPSTFNGSGTLNSITLSATAIGTIATSSQLYPTVVGTFTSIAHAASETAWVGGWHSITSEDMTGKLFALQWGLDVASTNAVVGTGGVIAAFSDGTNWVAYQLASKTKGWGANSPETVVIAVGAGTPYRSSSDEGGGAMNLGAITQRGYFWNRAAGSSNSFNLFVRNALTISTRDSTTPAYGAHLTGGGSEFPATPGDFSTALTSWEYTALASRQAEGQIVTRIDMVFGDGTNKTYVDASAVPVTFPQAWSSTDSGNWQMNWNVPTLKLYYGVKTTSTDTINLIADAFVAPNKQLMAIDSGSNTGATVSVAGSSIVGTTFTDAAGFALATGTYKSGGTVTLKGSATGLNVSKTVGAVPALAMTANSKTLSGCTTDVTGTSATYHLETSTAVDAITLTNHVFTGDATSVVATIPQKVHVLKTTGTVTITISGTTSLAANEVTSEGATVSIDAPQLYQSVTVSGFTAGSRIQIYDTTNSAELFNGTASAGNTVVSGTTATWTDPTAAAGTRAIRVRVAYVSGTTAKQFIETSGLTCGVTSGTESITYPITQVADTTYDSNAVNGSAVTGITFTDAATDLVNINLAANTTPLKDIYAAFVYWIFTAAGIDDDVAYIDAPDPANYIMTSMKFRNTSANPLKITGGYFYDSTGSVENCVDVTGSTGNIYPMPEHVVPYQTTGTYAITGDLQDALDAIAGVPADVWADSKALTVPKFLGLK